LTFDIVLVGRCTRLCDYLVNCAFEMSVYYYYYYYYYIWYSEEGTRWGRSPPRPLLSVPNVTTHPLTASVPVTILLYNGPLLCSCNVPIKGLTDNLETYLHLNTAICSFSTMYGAHASSQRFLPVPHCITLHYILLFTFAFDSVSGIVGVSNTESLSI